MGYRFRRTPRSNAMKTIFGFQPISIMVFLVLLLSCYASNAGAQVPTKEIKVYNNSTTDTIYPVLWAFIGDVDLWLQAQFGVSPKSAGTQTFCNNAPALFTPCPSGGGSQPPAGAPPILFRAWVNPDKGILPGQFVSITVPFYTQLAKTTPKTLGTSSAQYIDWWNAARITFYDGVTAKTGAFNYNVDSNGNTVPPTPVSPIKGAVIPSCASDNTFNCEPLTVVSYIGTFPTGSIPFDFGEYTLAAAEGPPPGGLLKPGDDFKIDLSIVNFNVSAVDGVYLPIAMAASGNSTPGERVYLGTTSSFSTVTTTLSTFSNTGASWPYYWPSYFSISAPTTPKPTPQDGNKSYRLPKIPSTNVVFAESYKVPTPAPPVISSNTKPDQGANPALGTAAKAIVTLWTTCTTTAKNTSNTCVKIRDVFNFFKTNYSVTCGLSPLPNTPTMLTQVTGWAEFPNCSHALADTPGYAAAIGEFCELEYNYLSPDTKTSEIFNPYAKLIHQTLKTNAYAFSVDDKAAFLGVPGDGLLITIGGPKGLIYPNEQYPLPTLATISKYCH
jgi:hypothetical protein